MCMYIFFVGLRLQLGCNNNGIVYTDGVRMLDCGYYPTINIIPKATRVIGILASNDGGQAHIQMYVYNGFATGANNAWKCTSQWYSEWKNVEYDDSKWDVAADKGQSDIVLDDNTRKIWTDDVLYDSVVYCRGHMGGC